MKLMKISMLYFSRRITTSPYFFIGLFSILSLVGILNHAMWRDEMNVWLIAKDSESFAALLDHIHYDRGHPALWHLLVTWVQKLWDNPLSMQLLHWTIAVGFITLLWLSSPFKQWEKILFTFGYLPFFEFTLISRNYGLGLFFLFLFCTTFGIRQKTYLIPSLCLVLMANSNIYGLLIGSALVLLLVVEWISDRSLRLYYLSHHQQKLDLILSIVLIIAGFIFALYMIFPPVLNREILTEEVQVQGFKRLLVGLGRILGGYTFLIPSQKQLWGLWICGILALGLLIAFSFKLRNKPLILGWYLLCNVQLLVVAYLSFPGRGSRHYGHFYLILIAALWLAHYYPDRFWLKSFRLEWMSQSSWKNWVQGCWIFVLVIQFGGGVYGFYQDFRIPYSAAKATSEFIIASHWDREFMVGSRDINMAGISGYLDRKLYYPERGELASFSLPLKYPRQDLEPNQVFDRVAHLLQSQVNLHRILLILNRPLDPTLYHLLPTIAVQPIQEFKKSSLHSEKFYLYWADRTE